MYNKQQKIFDDNCYWQKLLERILDSFLKNILSANWEDLPVEAGTFPHEEAMGKVHAEYRKF